MIESVEAYAKQLAAMLRGAKYQRDAESAIPGYYEYHNGRVSALEVAISILGYDPSEFDER